MTPQQQAALQSALIAVGGALASFGVISTADQASIASIVPVVLGAGVALIGAVLNHKSAGAGK